MADKINQKATWSNVSNKPKTIIESLTVEPTPFVQTPLPNIDLSVVNEVIHNASNEISEDLSELSTLLRLVLEKIESSSKTLDIKTLAEQVSHINLTLNEAIQSMEDTSKNTHLAQAVFQTKINELMSVLRTSVPTTQKEVKLSMPKSIYAITIVLPLIYIAALILSLIYLR